MPWRETSPMDQRRRFIGDYYRQGSGTSTSVPSCLDGWTSESSESRTIAAVGFGEKCYPCLRTDCHLSPRPLTPSSSGP